MNAAPLSTVAWTLLHFLWQGSIVTIATAVALRVLRDHPSTTRYGVACGALLSMAVLPAMTFWARWGTPAAGLPIPIGPEAAPAMGTLHGTVVLGWLAGVGLVALRHLRAWSRVRSWAAAGLPEGPHRERVGELCHRVGLSRAVRVVVSPAVDVPTVVGFVRPMILLPISAWTGLPAAQLDALLVHELAHIRRYDPLINLLQLIIETLLFYHPGVWWISRQIRIERENCCDDLAVACCGDQRTYLQALAGLESLRAASGAMTLSAKGGSLVSRVRRLANQTDAKSSSLPVMVAVGLLLFSLGMGFAACENPAQTTQTPSTDDPLTEESTLAKNDWEDAEGPFLVRVELEDGSVQEFTAESIESEHGDTSIHLKGGAELEWVDADGEVHRIAADEMIVDRGVSDELAAHGAWIVTQKHTHEVIHDLVERGIITKEEVQALHHGDDATVRIEAHRLAEIKILLHEALQDSGELHEE